MCHRCGFPPVSNLMVIHNYFPGKLSVSGAWVCINGKTCCTVVLHEKLTPIPGVVQIFPKTSSLVELFYVTGKTFFVENLQKYSIYTYFCIFLNILLTKLGGKVVFLSRFYFNFRNWLWPLEYPLKLKLKTVFLKHKRIKKSSFSTSMLTENLLPNL